MTLRRRMNLRLRVNLRLGVRLRLRVNLRLRMHLGLRLGERRRWSLVRRDGRFMRLGRCRVGCGGLRRLLGFVGLLLRFSLRVVRGTGAGLGGGNLRGLVSVGLG